MRKTIFLMILPLITGCTVSLTLANTHGTASDVVDSTPTTETKTDANLSVPATTLGGL